MTSRPTTVWIRAATGKRKKNVNPAQSTFTAKHFNLTGKGLTFLRLQKLHTGRTKGNQISSISLIVHLVIVRLMYCELYLCIYSLGSTHPVCVFQMESQPPSMSCQPVSSTVQDALCMNYCLVGSVQVNF